MNMVIPDEGKLKWLKWAVTSAAVETDSYQVDLFKNDYMPVAASTRASFVACDFAGYEEQRVYREDGSDPVIVVDAAETTFATPPTYTCTGGVPQTAYGWVMIDNESEIVLAAQRFDVPRLMAPGAVLTLDPFTLKLRTLVG